MSQRGMDRSNNIVDHIKNTSFTQLLVALLVAFQVTAAIWAGTVSWLSATGNGMIYSIEQPVPVVDVQEHTATIRLTRNARWSMSGECANEIECGGIVTELEWGTIPLEKGLRTFSFTLPVPNDSLGPCQFRGTVNYEPLGPLGPRFTHEWVSEEFEPL
jgi:hypothetical protein